MKHLVDINDAIEHWHTDNAIEMSLCEFLGMSREQYARWVECRMSAEELAEMGYCES